MLVQERIGLKFCCAVTVTYLRTPGGEGQTVPSSGGHVVTDVPSSQVQVVVTSTATGGVTGENALLAKVSPKSAHNCCFVEVVGSVTDVLFQFALAYSAP